MFLPGESQGWGSRVGCCLWGRRVRHDWRDLAAAAAEYILKEEGPFGGLFSWLVGKESAGQCLGSLAWVWSLIQEDPACRGATKTVYPTTEPAPQSPAAATLAAHATYRPCPKTRGATAMRSPHPATGEQPPCLHLEESPCSNKDPAQSKIKGKNCKENV